MQESSADMIDLRVFFKILWGYRYINIVLAVLVVVAAILVTLQLPNVYRAEVLLMPAEESGANGLGAIAGQFGGLASLAGVNIEKGKTDKATLAIEIMKSRAFLFGFIERHNMIVPLLAGKKWDQDSNTLVLNPKIYDEKTGAWLGKYAQGAEKKPTALQAYNSFMSMLTVSKAKETSLVNVGIQFVSPQHAKQWVQWLIDDINRVMKESDIKEAEQSIGYMNAQLEKTSLSDMKQVFYQLIEKQVQTMMIANVRDQYVFKVIDPPVIPEEKVSPKRGAMVLLSVFIFEVLFVMWAFVFKFR